MGDKVEEKKLSYEELKNVCGQLQQQNAFMREQMLKMHNEELYKRIDYLFKVVENKQAFSNVFYDHAVNEIEEILTLVEQEESK